MEIEQIKIDKVFKVCPNCGYEHGFHPMFERIGKSKELHCYFICPSCHKIYDIGLTFTTKQ